ncbi:hypothetical protein R50073_21880 [Maricurvus nonylphenolicus]
MYMDGVVAYGIVIVALTCVVVGYVGRYMIKHIREDAEKAEKQAN